MEDKWKQSIALLKRKTLATKSVETMPNASQFNPLPVRGNFDHENYDFMCALETHIDNWRKDKA